MKLEDILIKKEEIPISAKWNDKPYFVLPVHPKLLDKGIKLDKNLAHELFPKVVDGWYTDLKKYADGLEEGKSKEWVNEVFLKEKPYVKKEFNHQVIYPRGSWEDKVGTKENGYAWYFELERDIAGTIFVPDDSRPMYIGPKHVNFSQDKFDEYAAEKREDSGVEKGAVAIIYSFHNVEIYPSALLLRNWAIEYQNEALKQITK